MTPDTDAVRAALAERVTELAAERDALLAEVIRLRHSLRAERARGGAGDGRARRVERAERVGR